MKQGTVRLGDRGARGVQTGTTWWRREAGLEQGGVGGTRANGDSLTKVGGSMW